MGMANRKPIKNKEMRKNIVAGNWKMNLSTKEALDLNASIEKYATKKEINCAIYQFPSSIYLSPLLCQSEKVVLGAQNGYPEPKGAFTGEISMHQLAKMGVKSVLIGHSERRQIFHETNALLKQKVDAAISEELEIFFCCGETLAQREAGHEEEVIVQQLNHSLFHLSAADFSSVVIAYEPIWAIGTGKTATPEQANAIHQTIRRAIAEQYTEDIAKNTSILYGGSCKPSNANHLFSMSDIDGGLIGGAALNAADFEAIISTFNEL